jgi:uncharacterized protein YoxC
LSAVCYFDKIERLLEPGGLSPLLAQSLLSMDGFSGAAAVLSLTIQLASTVHSIRQFLRNVENAPKELASVIEHLDLLHQILSYLEDFMQRQATLEHPPISDALVTSALQSCEKRVRSVEDQVKPFTARLFRRHWLQKALGSMKFVLKKEDIQTSQVLVGGAIQMLQLALFTNQYETPNCTSVWTDDWWPESIMHMSRSQALNVF